MRLFRIASEKYVGDLSGTGARLYGGRWSPKGTPAVYASESTALAALEVLVHQPVDMAPGPLLLIEIDLPDNIKPEAMKPARLAKDWRDYPFPESTVKLGGEWMKKNSAVALKVPSAVMPYGKGWNFILNPMNPEFSRVKIVGREPFSFVERLFRR